jgi:hypothetical protein
MIQLTPRDTTWFWSYLWSHIQFNQYFSIMPRIILRSWKRTRPESICKMESYWVKNIAFHLCSFGTLSSLVLGLHRGLFIAYHTWPAISNATLSSHSCPLEIFLLKTLKKSGKRSSLEGTSWASNTQWDPKSLIKLWNILTTLKKLQKPKKQFQDLVKARTDVVRSKWTRAF